MQIPKYVKTGSGKLGDMEDCLRKICDFLPSLVIQGDNRTTSVSHYPTGTIIKSKAQSGGAISSLGQTQATPYWKFSLEFGSGRLQKVFITGGYYNRNGYIIPWHINSDLTPEKVFIDGGNWQSQREGEERYIYLVQEWTPQKQNYSPSYPNWKEPYIHLSPKLIEPDWGTGYTVGFILLGIICKDVIRPMADVVPTMLVAGRTY